MTMMQTAYLARTAVAASLRGSSFPNLTRQATNTMATTTTKITTRQQQCLRALQIKYLERWSTHAFKMEYEGYLSNHLVHALAALTDLGANDNKVDQYADSYARKLCVVEDRARAELGPTVLLADADTLRGKRQNYEGLRAMYEAEIKSLTVDGAITQHLPNLVGGLAGSLLHGIIQLGYAYHVGGDQTIAEGLAYLHFSYLPFDVPKGESESVPTETKPFTREAAFALAKAVQKDTQLFDTMYENLKRPVFDTVVQGDLQRRLMSFSSDPAVGNPELFAAVRAAVDQFDFGEITGNDVMDFVLWLYLVTPPNDFVILHAATSAWSLHQVEHLLAVDDKTRGWKTWFRMALSGFIMHEVPPLPVEDPVGSVDAVTVVSLPSWDEIFSQALALEGDVDEHVYKLVQVAHNVVLSNRDQSGFLTPTQREFVAKSAALKVMRAPFSF